MAWRTVGGVMAAVLVLGACSGDDGEEQPAAADGDVAACQALDAGRDEVDVRADWATGDRVELELRTDLHDDTVPVTITVEEARPDGWTLRWEQRRSLWADLPDEFDDLATASIRYTTDPSGAFVEVLNRDEALDQSEELVERLGQEIGDTNLTEALDRETLRAGLEADELSDIAWYHSAYGTSLAPDRPDERVVSLDSPLRGSLPARQTLAVDELADDRGCLVLGLDAEPGDRALRRYQREFIADLTADELAQLRIARTGTFVWDPGSTWMVDVESVTQMTGPDLDRREERRLAARGLAGET
jgi:hypothetical protein